MPGRAVREVNDHSAFARRERVERQKKLVFPEAGREASGKQGIVCMNAVDRELI